MTSKRVRGAIIAAIAVIVVPGFVIGSAVAAGWVDRESNRVQATLEEYVSHHSANDLGVDEFDLIEGHRSDTPRGVQSIVGTPSGGIVFRETVSVLWEHRCVAVTREKSGVVIGITHGTGYL